MKTIKLNDLKTKLKAISLSNTDLGRYGDGFEEAMHLVNKAVEAINYSQCSIQLKNKEETAFDLWLKNFEYAENVDSFWFEKDMLLCRDEMKLRYNEVKPKL